jgi:hypothetical protein
MPFCFIAPKTLNCVAFQTLDFEGAYRKAAPQIFGEVGWHIFYFSCFCLLFVSLHSVWCVPNVARVFTLCGVFPMLPVSSLCVVCSQCCPCLHSVWCVPNVARVFSLCGVFPMLPVSSLCVVCSQCCPCL